MNPDCHVDKKRSVRNRSQATTFNSVELENAETLEDCVRARPRIAGAQPSARKGSFSVHAMRVALL